MRRFLPAALAGLGVVLLVAGVVVFAGADGRDGPDGSDGTAYTGSYLPLEPGDAYSSELTLTFDDAQTVLWTGRHLLGAGLGGTGLLVVAAVGGWWLGRRSAARD